MKNKTLWLLLIVMVVLSTGALAENVSIIPHYYRPINDLSPQVTAFKDLTEEEIQTLRNGYFYTTGLLPLEQDNLLLYGTFQYDSLLMEPSHKLGYDRPMKRTDAYAVAIDKNGDRVWSLRISDPQAENSFANAWFTDDNRILIKYENMTGEWGSQYYLVSLEGEIQEMLPSYKAKQYGVSETIIPVQNGYIAGGLNEFEGVMTPMLYGSNITLFSQNMDVEWRLEDNGLTGASFKLVDESDEGFLFVGSITPVYDVEEVENIPRPAAVMISRGGEVLWKYLGDVNAVGAFQDAILINDGGVLLAGMVDPSIPTPYDVQHNGTLTKLNQEGEHEWSKQYLETEGIYIFEQIEKYKNGYMMSGIDSETYKPILLYLDSEGLVLGRREVDLIDGERDYFRIATGLETRLYAFGYVEDFALIGEEEYMQRNKVMSFYSPVE